MIQLLHFKITFDIQFINVYTFIFVAISSLLIPSYEKTTKNSPILLYKNGGLKNKISDNTYIYCNLSNPEIGDLFGIEGRTSTKAGIILDGNSEIATAN